MADDEQHDDPLVRALRGPGTPDELADEDRYRAMFREAAGAPSGAVTPLRGRSGVGAARRFGSGTALTVALAVAGTGVAAAYTGNLPDPIQDLAHRALGPVGPPAPERHHRQRATEPVTTPSATAEGTPTTSATADPSSERSPSDSPTATSKPSHQPSASPSASEPTGPAQPASTGPTSAPASPTPSASPTEPTPTTSPSPTTPPPPVLVPTTVSITGETHRVDIGQAVGFSGRVTSDDGTPVPRVRVALERRVGTSWQRVGFARTARDGTVRLTLPPVTESTAVRLRIRDARSPRWKVSMHPLMTLTSAPSEQRSVTITATVQGGRAGDSIHLLARAGGGVVASGVLGADGSVRFDVTPPKPHVRYVVYLDATTTHTAEHEGIAVTRPQP